MKITLGLNISYNGYENLGFVKTLDPFAGNSECTEILAPDILNYIESDKVEEFIIHLTSKLRHGGKIILGGNDIISLAQFILSQPHNMNILSLNKLVYGDSLERPIACQLHVNFVSDVLQKCGLKIDKMSLDGYKFIVEATRP